MYRWNNPYEWFVEKIRGESNIDEVRAICCMLARKLDSDAIQDIFEREMDNDGYFEKV